jgi:hypothetical protein
MLNMIEHDGLSSVCLVEDNDEKGLAMKTGVENFKCTLAGGKPLASGKPLACVTPDTPTAPELLAPPPPPKSLPPLNAPPLMSSRGISLVGTPSPTLPLTIQQKEVAAAAASTNLDMHIDMTEGHRPAGSLCETPQAETPDETPQAETPDETPQAKTLDETPAIAEPKGAKNAFLYYSMAVREEIKNQNPEASLGELSRIIGQSWKDLDAEEQQPYNNLAVEDKQRYQSEVAAFQAAGGVMKRDNKKKKEAEPTEEQEASN